MNKNRGIVLAIAFSLFGVAVGTSPATAAIAQEPGRSDAKTAIVFGAVITKQAVDNSNAETQALYKRLDDEAAAKNRALRRAGIAESEARKLHVEIAELRRLQAELIAKIAVNDAEYAAAIRAFREGIEGLFADSDPKIVEALERYAAGDVTALDDLQAYTRIVRKAREAGLRARNGADQRGVALLMQDAKDKGQRTSRQALDTWIEAVEVDPESFSGWMYVCMLQREVGNRADAGSAAAKAIKLARTLPEQAGAWEQAGELAREEGRYEDARRAFDKALGISRQTVAQDPKSISAKRDLASSLLDIGDLARVQRQFPQAHRAYDEAQVLRTQLSASYPDRIRPYKDMGVILARQGLLAENEGNYDIAWTEMVGALKIFQNVSRMLPNSEAAQFDEALALQDVGHIASLKTRYSEAGPYFDQAVTIMTGLVKTNPSDRNVHELARSLEGQGASAVAGNRLADAEAAFAREVGIRRAAKYADPTSVQARDILATSLDRLARLHEMRGRYEVATSEFREAVELLEGLNTEDVLLQRGKEMLQTLRPRVGMPATILD